MDSINERIAAFVAVQSYSGYGSGSYSIGFGDGSDSGYGDDGSGYGDGSGDGSGYGSGYGDGNGSGYCSGSGSGNGYGYGSGSGFGGVKSFCGEPVHYIDGVATIIRSVHGNCARGRILNSDLTLTPCVIVKQDGLFAHGKTLRAAMTALRDKLFEDMPEDKRIEAFWAEHELGRKYPVKDFYEWHHRLTGSCELGRQRFASEHGIDIGKDEMTVEEFVKLTRNAYGGDVIRKLEKGGAFCEAAGNIRDNPELLGGDNNA